MDTKVNNYFSAQNSPQKEICKKVRELLFAALPDITEEFKNGVPWYGKFYIVGLKDSVNVGFSIIGLNDKDIKLFSGKGKYMRHVKIHTIDEVDPANLTKLFLLVDKYASCYEK